jgi:hypothetical protein
MLPPSFLCSGDRAVRIDLPGAPPSGVIARMRCPVAAGSVSFPLSAASLSPEIDHDERPHAAQLRQFGTRWPRTYRNTPAPTAAYPVGASWISAVKIDHALLTQKHDPSKVVRLSLAVLLALRLSTSQLGDLALEGRHEVAAHCLPLSVELRRIGASWPSVSPCQLMLE